jgi:cholesterol oxidase
VFPDDVTQVQADRYPAGADALAPMTTLMVDGGGRVPRWLRFIGTVLRHPIDFLRTAWPFGFARQTVILVVMQTLDNQLRMSLRRRWWFPLTRRLQSHRGPEDGAPTYIPIANEFARRMAKKLDAVPIASVTEVLADIPITAHILGGSIIGTGTESGVVDSRHRAFGYDGLLVCDGSVIPANLGANPALSITAFAERALSFVPTKHGTLRHLKVDTLWGTSPLISGDSER